MPFRRRRPGTRRFLRRDSAATSPSPGIGVPPDLQGSGSPTPKRSQDSTAQLPAIVSGQTPLPRTGENAAAIPDPPDRLEFSCPCGRRLAAARRLFDRRSKCGFCKTVLLLNLIYRSDLGLFEIEPFRVDGALDV
jgi:hypothetical protein